MSNVDTQKADLMLLPYWHIQYIYDDVRGLVLTQFRPGAELDQRSLRLAAEGRQQQTDDRLLQRLRQRSRPGAPSTVLVCTLRPCSLTSLSLG
jgi:hypothetical protein